MKVKFAYCKETASVNMDKIVYNIIHMPNQPDSVKKALLVKVVQSSPLKNSRPLDQADVTAIFDSCVSIVTTTDNDAAAHLAVFAFTNWAGQYKGYLKEYLTPERVTSTLNSPGNPVVVVQWLREAVLHLTQDSDAVCGLAPMVGDLLQNKLRECGGSSAFLAKLSDLYGACPGLLPQPHTRLAFTVTLMNCVAAFPTPTKTEVLGHMKSIGGLVNTLWNGLRLEDILHSLHSMYAIISNTEGGSEVCPAMAHLLSLVPTVVVEGLAPRIVSDPATTDAAMTATLTRLTTWLVSWPTAHDTLALWVRTLVHLLYQGGRTAVPAKITLDRVPKLLAHVHIPVVRVGVVTVCSTLLLSFQQSPIAFHKLIPELLNVFSRLEREGSESASAMLGRLATLCHTLMALYPGYPDTYHPLMDVLGKYPSPSEEEIQELIREHQWLQTSKKSAAASFGGPANTEVPSTYQKRPVSQRAGLRNLGNTCYMNSVIQALFMTDSFRHGILHAVPRSNQHLLVKLQHLFSLLCFTHRMHVSPRLFHDKSRPPWFSPGMQQDCSEYLRHLMITLHEEERAGQKLPEYRERVIIESETASLASDLQPLPYDSATEDFAESETTNKVAMCEEEQAMFMSMVQRRKGEGESDQREKQKYRFYGKGYESPGKTEMFEEFSSESSENILVEEYSHKSFKLGGGKNDVCYDKSGDVEMVEESEEQVMDTAASVEEYEPPNAITATSAEGEITSDTSETDNTLDASSKHSSYKRKHNMTQEGIHRQILKSPKGDMTSDVDNSSDSGISGDLAEDIDLHLGSPNVCSPAPPAAHSSKDGVTIEELTDDAANSETGNEYFVSLVQKIFGGKLATCIKCLQCKTESIHKDVFTDIHLAFQDNDQCNAATVIKRNPERMCKQTNQDNQTDLRIEDMIKNYLTSEKLTGENQYECERCGGKQDAERSIQILEPPEHLILTQLRFYYDTVRAQRQKVFTNVEFGEELLLPIQYSPKTFLGETFGDGDANMKGVMSESGIESINCAKENSRLPVAMDNCKSSATNSDSTSVHSMQTDCSTPTECREHSGKERQCQKSLTSSECSQAHLCSSVKSCDINSRSPSSYSGDMDTENVSTCRNCEVQRLREGSKEFCLCTSRAPSLNKPCYDETNPSLDYSSSFDKPGCSSYTDNKKSPVEYSSGSSGRLTPNEGCEEPQVFARYALYGVVVHSGFSSEGGHYYCYARNSSIAGLPESAKERYNAVGGWYNFNDERVTSTTFSAITNLTRTFTRDTAYQLFYKKVSESECPEVPLMEDLRCLQQDLKEAVESDNLQYRLEQDKDGRRRYGGGPHYPRDSDHDSTPPPGGCGGPGFNTPSRVVF